MIRGTILVVDDSPLTLEALRRGLEAAAFVVRSAGELADIPKTARGTDLDLILMDVEMAEAFGDDVAMVLRNDAPGPPIYLLSALPTTSWPIASPRPASTATCPSTRASTRWSVG